MNEHLVDLFSLQIAIIRRTAGGEAAAPRGQTPHGAASHLTGQPDGARASRRKPILDAPAPPSRPSLWNLIVQAPARPRARTPAGICFAPARSLARRGPYRATLTPGIPA